MKSKLFIAGASVAAILAAATMVSADAGGPTAVLSSTASSTTNMSSIPITATFSAPVTGLASSSITVTNGSIGSFAGSGSSYTFDLMPSAQGTTTVMIPANAAMSASSTGNQASNTLTFMYDTTAPVIAQVTGIASTTTDTTPSYTFSSTEAGTIALSGGCTSSTTAAASGDNTIMFNALGAGMYNCSLSVTDAAGNMSNALPINFTEESATTTPTISDILVSDITTDSAMITWNTDVSSGGTVNFGTSTPYTMSMSDAATSTMSHAVTLTGLSEATLYHFDVQSGSATSSDQQFTTGSTASTTPLAINTITPIQSTGVADNTFTDGWSWDINFTVPSNENAFRIRFSDWGNASSSFPTGSDVQIYSPESSNATSSASAITETDNGYSGWLYLNGDTASTTPGDQVDLIVDVKIPFGTPTGSYSSDFTAETYPSTATSTAM